MSNTAPAIVPLDLPPETGDRRSYWVCVVDDDAMFREYACRQLSELKHRPFPAQNGSELQEILADNRIDCVVLDYNLEGENGLEVYERMRRRNDSPGGHADVE
jgi:two-component system OmpR family response regulator